MKLLVGLGNPGEKYAGNRHNVGFLAVDSLAERHRFSPWRKRFQGTSCEGELGAERVVLLKPETYMNESGRSVGEAVRYLKITPADVIVFHDELDLDPGRVRLKLGGGNAGHNGLRSISALVSNEYFRVRIGIGHPGHKDAVAAFVLHDFAKADMTWLDPLLEAMADAAPALLTSKPELFLTKIAQGSSPEPTPTPKPALERPAKPKHPAGERGSKQQNAIAENLKKWLAGRTKTDD
jgi:peptidyl-tRNA hydrolase, PTH1 family